MSLISIFCLILLAFLISVSEAQDGIQFFFKVLMFVLTSIPLAHIILSLAGATIL